MVFIDMQLDKGPQLPQVPKQSRVVEASIQVKHLNLNLESYSFPYGASRRLPSPPGPGICFFCLPLPPAASRPPPGVIDRAGAIGDGFGVGGRV